MLDKGKGPVLGKLRIIELIEGDLQLIICTYVGLRNDKNVHKDKWLSNYNFRLRKDYSIESTLLEKRLTHSTSKHSGVPTIHLISDLEACYDRQILAIGRIVEESLGVD